MNIAEDTKPKVKRQEELTAVHLEKVEAYEEAFAKIEAATGIQNIDVLVAEFIKAEEANFKMFRFVNSQADEIEQLENSIQELKDELWKY